MDLRAHSFRCFILLAEELSFTRAAARAGLTQSALSMRIRDMEARLGVALFVRSSRAVTLSPAGAELLDQARRIVAETERFQDICEQLRTTPEAPVLLAMPVTGLGNERWMAAVDRFRALEPAADVQLSRRASPDVLAAVEAGRADIGFVAGHPGPGLPCLVLGRQQLDIALPEEWPAAVGPGLSAADIAGLRIAAFDKAVNPGLHAECFDGLRALGAELVPSADGILGGGFASRKRLATLVFPEMRRTLPALGLRLMPLSGVTIAASLCAVRRSDASRRPVRRFWEVVRSMAIPADTEAAPIG